LIAVLCSTDRFLQDKVLAICAKAGMRVLQTNKSDRIIKELKQPSRVAIIDMVEKSAQERGALRQMVNVGKISGNQVICICPNQEEELKKMAAAARPEEVFLRYDLQTSFTECIEALSLQAKESKAS